jgi:ankyrin repeat protein
MGQLECTKVLLAAGAEINIKNYYDGTPLDYAIQKERKEVATYLYQKGGRPNTETWPTEWQKPN